ncbi:MAG: serine/threonine-protein kinase [Acidobacteriota bacterium]
MVDDRWQQTQELFELALDAEPADRERLLSEACSGDDELRKAVDRLLAGHDNAPSFLDHPEEINPLMASDALVGQQIGPYRLEQMLGEGGMGVVYRASQERPIRRTVALKLIQLGMATREVIARFESERQALAMLDHPNIARVFDAGASEQGNPYFAMELVDGVEITRYCDEHTLSTRQRLALFMQVCRAVHHAHQKGIIHRDLKPSNVMVTEVDGEPVPKVIDFGVARAVDSRQGGRTALTQFGGFLGTPEYMSPEQAAMELDIDTRTDVYSLGVLLYELLIGRLPFDSKSLRAGTPERLRELLRDSEAEPPSTRVSTLGDEAQEIAQRRRTRPSELRQELKGDLDWIVMRALEKERQRRYGSASELAEDLARHLRNEPVAAGPPELGYRVGKFVRRNWIGVAVTASAVVLLLVFAIVTSWQAAQLRTALAESERQTRKTEEVTAFLTDLFQISDPDEARGNAVSAREILDRGAQRVATELNGQPEIQAAMMRLIGTIYLQLGLYPEAEELIVGSHELLQRLLGRYHRDIAGSHALLSDLRQQQDNLPAAVREARLALETLQAISHDRIDEARLLTRLASTLRTTAQFKEAEEHLRRALAIWESTADAPAVELSATVNELSMTYGSRGKYEAAEAQFRRAIQLLEDANPGHPSVAVYKLNLASVLGHVDRNEEAEALLQDVLARNRVIYGDEHYLVANAMNNLARVYQQLGKRDEAEMMHREVLDMRRRLQGNEHSDVAVALANLGVVMRQKGQYQEAEALYREALAINQRVLGPDHPTVGIEHHNLGVMLRRAGRPTEAEPEIRRAIEIFLGALGEDHLRTSVSRAALGKTLILLDRLEDAENVLRTSLDSQLATLPAGHSSTSQTRMFMGQCLSRLGRLDEAEPYLLAALEGHREARGPSNENTLEALDSLAALYDAWGRPEDAERYRAQADAAAPSA